MKIEWLLSDLDKEVRVYTELRAQLSELPSDSDEYIHAEADLGIQIMRLKTEINKLLGVMDETDS
jgi:hypothetical protein